MILLLATTWLATAQAQEPAPASEPAPTTEELPILSGPSIVNYVEAVYPPEAQEAGLEATVRLRIALTETGEVDNVEVIEAVGNGFDEAAVDAVFEMQFEPAMTAAGPVPVVLEFEYGFVLEPEEPEVVEAPINLQGQLKEMATRKPIAGVQVVVEGTDLLAVSDDDGRFELRGVPLGAAKVRMVHVGHVTEEREVEITEGDVLEATWWMRAEAYRDNEVVAVYERPKDEVTRRTITMAEVRKVPGTFGDPIKVIQTLPGAARTPFGTGFLIIRGANPEDSGVYVDGIRIPIIYHLTGTTSVLAPDLIEAVDYLPGGYGVQYGRTMGGTIDVRTKSDFDEGKFVWNTDILDTNLYFEGKVGKEKKLGIAAGARRSYIDAFIPIFTGGTGFTIKPRYWDYQLKVVPELSDRQSFSVFLYGFDDILRIGTPAGTAQGSDQDTQGDLQTKYNSHRLIVQYGKEFSDEVKLDVSPSIGLDGADLGLGDSFRLKNTQLLLELRSQVAYRPVPELEFIPGVDVIGGWWGFTFESAINIEAFDDPLAEREDVGLDGSGSAWGPDLFFKTNIRPLDSGSDKLLITPGIRFNMVNTVANGSITGSEGAAASTNWSLDPRILSRFQIHEKFAVKGASGLYHQPPQAQELLGVGTESSIQHEVAWSNSVGFEHRITDAIHWDVEGFYRKMDDLIVLDDNWTGFGANPYFNGGVGRAYGVEVIARHDPVGRFFGWVSYTLSRSTRRDTESCDAIDQVGEERPFWGDGPCWYPFDFDQRHIFSAQGGYDLPRDFGVSAQVQYVTGNPSSNFNAGIYDADSDSYFGFRTGGFNDERLPPYFQTSVRFDKLWTFKTWQLETYVDLLNAVRGVNPEFTNYNYDYSEFAYVRGLPFIPNIGLEARFQL